MIQIFLKPGQLVAAQLNKLVVHVTNTAGQPCTGLRFILNLPPEIERVEGSREIILNHLEAGETKRYELKVWPQQVGSFLATTLNFAYCDPLGQPQREPRWSQLLEVKKAVSGFVPPQEKIETNHKSEFEGKNTIPNFINLIPKFLENAELFELANELLKCRAIGDPGQRKIVVDQLPPEIRQRITEDNLPQSHTYHILATCNHYSNGLNALFRAIYRVEGNSIAWENLLAYLQKIKR